MNAEVDLFLNNGQAWQDELKRLHTIILDCGLTETFKWGNPCYTHNGKNIVLIHAFKDYCAVLFFKGALLKDDAGILIQQTANVQAGRQMRFTSAAEIAKQKATLKAYLFEALEVEKVGLKVALKKTEDFAMPDELKQKFKEVKALKKAFEALTPGRQKGYLLHFAAAKQSATRTARIEANIERIMGGKGLTDCICGLSKRFPTCDGSHKNLR